MNFFNSHDWLNRTGPYAFKLDHILFIVIAMTIGVLLSLYLRKKERKTITIVLIILWAICISVETFYYTYTYINCAINPSESPFNIQTMLPFHSCLMFMYIFPLAIFTKNKIISLAAKNFLVVINMIMGFITLFVGCPGPGYSALSFQGFQTLTYHSIIVIVPMIMLITNYYDLKINDLKYGLILFLILASIMWTFDHFSGCDYFYIYDGHTFPVFKFISENVHHLVWTLIIVSSYIITGCAMHFIVVFIKYLVNKKKDRASSL